MKQLVSKLLLFAVILPIFAQANILATYAQTKTEANGPATTEANTDARIKRVEQGLLPEVLIQGDPSWSIAERMKFYKVPGLSIAVIKDFKVDWARAYGVKDIDTNEPVTTETLFQAGSISKSVNAMVAMKKVEQGKISLDEPINNKLVTWKLPDNEFTTKKKVTLRNLLSHTAGTTVHGFPGYAVNEKIPTLPQVLDGASPANTAPVRVDFEPGSKFRYSGGGITIAQLAIMDIEKQPYPEIAKKTVLEPLRMTNSTYTQPLPDAWRKQAASGHRPDGSLVAGKIHVYPEMAAAGLWTTPTDLAKFAIDLQLSLAGRANKVLSKDSVAMMTTPFMENVGLGFFIERHENTLYFGHGGADEGFRAELLVSREKGSGAVVMANSDNGNILREVLRGVAREYGWDEFLPTPHEIVSLEAAQLNDYLGRYLVNPDEVLTITNDNGKLIASPTLGQPFELLPTSDTKFVRRDSDFEYIFLPVGKDGAASSDSETKSARVFSGIRIRNPENLLVAGRIAPDMLVPFELLLAGKGEAALEGYRKLMQEKTDNASISEQRLNGLGYSLMRRKKLPEAIAIFKLNVEFYPQAWNTYDSLGEAYMTNGDKELAIASYKKSLALNPQNANGAEMLKKLEKQEP
jgi:CubicO group peptidase (beta-lactamase class C family)